MGGSRVFSARLLNRLMLLAVAVLLAGCAQTAGTVRGVVTSVEGALDDVTAFTLLAEGDETRYIPVEDGDYTFPLPHLREHQRTGEPVLVGWEKLESVHYALSLDDGD